MGDRALGRVVDLFADEEPWLTDHPSIRLEHATLVSPALLHRLVAARMRFAVVTHSIFLFAEFASDRPATAWADADDVFTSVRAAVTRRAHNGADMGRAERVTVAQALLLYTGRAAQVGPFPGLGRIAAGCDGSFVVVDPDPFSLPEDELDRVRVVQTWVRGTLAHRR